MSAADAEDGPARVLVTGASGLVGSQVVARLADEAQVVALDLRLPAPEDRVAGVVHLEGDIRDAGLTKILTEYGIDTVVHLAAVVTPGPGSTRELEYEIDVVGTRNVVDACIRAEVRQLIYTSSGAAYGYHADNPVPLRETDPLRGNEVFAYAWHKRLAEQALAEAREAHPALGQLIFRVGTILGEKVASPITALFERPVIVGVTGSDAPFVLIWDEDVAACIVKGIRERRTGIFNLAGDGALPLPEIARRLGKPYLPLPPWLLAGVLGALQRLGVSARGPEQVDFLRYRPVLANDALVSDFGFRPRFDSAGCFEHYRKLRFGASDA
ncbi:MAG: NAD-dependent epimerase/dehydratase family protein [Myxococcota bacterium]